MSLEYVEVTGLGWVRGKEQPIETWSRPIETTSWGAVALDSPAVFEKNLSAGGLSKKSIAEAMAVRNDSAALLVEPLKRLEPYRNTAFAESPPDLIDAQNFYDDRRSSALQRLSDWWNDRVTLVTATEPFAVRVPLFVLGAPATPDCKAEWTNEITSGFSRSWSVKIVGSGFSSDKGVTRVKSANFEAASGETKLIFCDVALILEHLEIRQPDKPPVRQWRIDLESAANGEVWPGLLLLDPDAVPPLGRFAAKYPLAGDPSGSVAQYTEKYIQTTKTPVEVGLKVHGIELGLKATSDFESDVEVKYTLKSGCDYRLFFAHDCDGYLFGPRS